MTLNVLLTFPSVSIFLFMRVLNLVSVQRRKFKKTEKVFAIQCLDFKCCVFICYFIILTWFTIVLTKLF